MENSIPHPIRSIIDLAGDPNRPMALEIVIAGRRRHHAVGKASAKMASGLGENVQSRYRITNTGSIKPVCNCCPPAT
jgi:hypothetical protein